MAVRLNDNSKVVEMVKEGLKKKNGRIDQIREGLGRTSKLLENTMTRRLQARMIKAYPNLEKEEKEDVPW